LRSIHAGANSLQAVILGQPQNGNIHLAFNAADAGAMQVNIYDLLGRAVFHQSIVSIKGTNRITLTPQSLQAGMYVIWIGNDKEHGIARVFVQ
jgi:hypothetical protein